MAVIDFIIVCITALPDFLVGIADVEGAKFLFFLLQIDFSLAVGGENEHVFDSTNVLLMQDIHKKLLFETCNFQVFSVKLPVVYDDEGK